MMTRITYLAMINPRNLSDENDYAKGSSSSSTWMQKSKLSTLPESYNPTEIEFSKSPWHGLETFCYWSKQFTRPPTIAEALKLAGLAHWHEPCIQSGDTIETQGKILISRACTLKSKD